MIKQNFAAEIKSWTSFRWGNLAILFLPLRLIRPPSDPHQPQGAGGGGGAGPLRYSYGDQCTTGREKLRTTKIWQSSISTIGVYQIGRWEDGLGELFFSHPSKQAAEKNTECETDDGLREFMPFQIFLSTSWGEYGWRSNKIETFWNISEPKMETLVSSKIGIQFVEATCGESYC